METSKTKAPNWYLVVAVILLLWNLMGLLSFFAHVFITDEVLASLPEQERQLYDEYPLWTNLIFAIAVFTGFAGAIGLMVKKKWARLAFILSLCAIVPQMIHNLFFTKSMEVYGTAEAVSMPIIVVVFGILSIWFTNYSIKKNWLN